MKDYNTVQKDGRSEIGIKHSDFLGYCRHVESTDEATAFVAEIRKKHGDARHNVYAYILRDGNSARYSDDGEPQGTAGLPVLDVLKRSGITDTAIVVTRYFGGILLGTGGLVRAYTQSARAALADAHPVSMRENVTYGFSLDYSLLGKIQSLLAKSDCEILSQDFADEVSMQIAIPVSNEDGFVTAFTDATFGRSVLTRGETVFRATELELPSLPDDTEI